MKRSLGISIVVAAVLLAPVAEAQQQQCPTRVEGQRVFLDCDDGSHFQAPVSGGVALGHDKSGNDLEAFVSVIDGQYFVSISPPPTPYVRPQ